MLSDSIFEQKMANEDVWPIKIGVADSNFEVGDRKLHDRNINFDVANKNFELNTILIPLKLAFRDEK
jgi:hypothetical protein